MLEKKKVSEAIRVDILRMLSKEDDVGIFELRRIETIARLSIDVVNSIGTAHEHTTLAYTLQRVQDVAPSLNDVLMNRAFDGDALLKQEYEKLIYRQQQLTRDALDLEQLQQRQAMKTLQLEAKTKQLELKAEELVMTEERVKTLAAQIGMAVGDDKSLLADITKKLLVMGEALERKDQEKLEKT